MDALEPFRFYDKQRDKVTVVFGFPIRIFGHPFFVHHALLPGRKQDATAWAVSEAETGLRASDIEDSQEGAVAQAKRKIVARGGAKIIRERIEAYKTAYPSEWAALEAARKEAEVPE